MLVIASALFYALLHNDGGNRNIENAHLSGILQALFGTKAFFGGSQSPGLFRPNGDPQSASGVTIDAGRNVNGKNRFFGGVEGRNHIVKKSRNRPPQPQPKNAVDDEIRATNRMNLLLVRATRRVARTFGINARNRNLHSFQDVEIN